MGCLTALEDAGAPNPMELEAGAYVFAALSLFTANQRELQDGTQSRDRMLSRAWKSLLDRLSPSLPKRLTMKSGGDQAESKPVLFMFDQQLRYKLAVVQLVRTPVHDQPLGKPLTDYVLFFLARSLPTFSWKQLVCGKDLLEYVPGQRLPEAPLQPLA